MDLIRTSQDARFGDYQANFAMPLGKKLGMNPREVAQKVIENLQWNDFLETPEIAGPGFINLRLRSDWLSKRIEENVVNPEPARLPVQEERPCIIDFSSPNVAKPLHVGHIRSTVIGNALRNILQWRGRRVIADNHLGDWGTQFGMIIYGFRNFLDAENWKKQPIQELGRLYRLVRQLSDFRAAQAGTEPLRRKYEQMNADLVSLKNEAEKAEKLNASAPTPETKKDLKKKNKAIQDQLKQIDLRKEEIESLEKKIANVENDPYLSDLARKHSGIDRAVLQETSKLHHGDQENLELWKSFMPVCLADIEKIYSRLGIKFDVERGESFYNCMLPGIVEDLKQKGLAKISNGAVCVFLENSGVPMLIQKSDGAFLYATTDLATIKYRMEHENPSAILYVVDSRQALHFENLFEAERMLGLNNVELRHIKFGTILGEDGTPFKTRSGDTVGLESLLDEAESRALTIITEKDDSRKDGPVLSVEERIAASKKIGIGALVYADLSQNRESDYVFSYDKMLAMNGNTAVYMQYAYARIRSIFSRAGLDLDEFIIEQSKLSDRPVLLNDPQERALALELIKFADALDLVISDYRPNQLTSYLYDLANKYTAFNDNCRVLTDDPEIRQSRLQLCALTAVTIKTGLDLLGIKTVERM